MKLAVSILLLTILTFNWVGYRFVSQYLEDRADEEVQASIDNLTYNEADLIEFRISLENTPYYSGTREFESFRGEVEIEGVHYNYVKRKIDRNELVLLCLPNENKTRARNSRIGFFKLVNDLDQSSNSAKEKNSSSSFKTFNTEYSQENNSWFIEPLMPGELKHLSAKANDLAAGFMPVLIQPPRS